MKTKSKKICKRFSMMVLVVCIILSTTVISVNASTVTKTGTTSLGYRVSSTATFSNKTVTGTGKVTNGGPCSIQVYAKGYYVSNGVYVLSCSIKDKVGNTQSLTKSTSGSYTLRKAVCSSTFNSETTVTATAT